MHSTITIVGAGPAGLQCAKHLSEKGWQATVLEEHENIGSPVQCAGLISRSGAQANELPLQNAVVNEIRGAKIFSPGGEALKIQRFETVALVIDRERLDQNCAEEAQKAGAEILTNTKLIGIRDDRLFVQRESRGEMRRTKILVGADGANSKTRGLMGVRLPSEGFVNAFQVRAKGRFDREFVELYFGGFAENFFAWVVPESKTVARIGLGCPVQKNAKKCFEEFAAKKELEYRTIESAAGIIPCSEPLKEPVQKNMVLLGDAAMQTKSTTGGGIVTGSIAARICADTISLHMKEKAKLEDYAKNLEHLNRDLAMHWKIRKYLNSLSNEKMDSLFKKLKNSKIEFFLEKHGNMDHPTMFAGKFMANPKNWFLFPELLRVLR